MPKRNDETTAAKRGTAQRKRRSLAAGLMALEPRVMYDGAAAVSAVHGDHHHDGAVHAANHVAPPAADLSTGPHAANAAPAPAAAPAPREVVFIDTSVENWQELAAGIPKGVETVLLQPDQDGLAQIAQWAATHKGYDSIQILSHGADGELQLGSAVLTDASLAGRQADLAAIGGALNAGGDIQLYGCDIAEGSVGQKFIDDISTAAHVRVEASIDATGAADLGGNWTLEATSSGGTDHHPLTASDQTLSITGFDGLLAIDPNHTIPGASPNFTPIETATDANGNVYAALPVPHTGSGAYSDVAIYKWTAATSTWNLYTTIDSATAGHTGVANQGQVALAVDASGELHAAVYMYDGNTTSGARGVYYGSFDGTSWTFTPVDVRTSSTGEYLYQYLKLTFDSNGNPNIGYVLSQSSGKSVMDAAPNGSGGWTLTAVATTGSNLNEPFLADVVADKSGHVDFVYGTFDSNFALNWSIQSSANWGNPDLILNSTADNDFYIIDGAAIDSHGAMHVIYYDQNLDAFETTSANGSLSGWTTASIGIHVPNPPGYELSAPVSKASRFWS